jgi:hypothetical protein
MHLKNKKIDYSFFYWGPFVLKTKIEKKIINKLYIEGKKSKVSYNENLAGHLNNQFKYSDETSNWFYEEFSSYLQCYRDAHCKFHSIPNLQVTLKPIDLWINFMKAGDFNPHHTHAGDYSFVIFLKVPEQLRKEIKNFKGTYAPPGSLMFNFTHNSRPAWSVTERFVIPEEGDLYIFPSLLTHSVYTFKSKVERVSVSGNIEIINRNELPYGYF